jgi:ketosteroid isomerase-like protein
MPSARPPVSSFANRSLSLPRAAFSIRKVSIRLAEPSAIQQQGASMVYKLIVKKEIRRSFDHVNNQRWDDAAKGLTPNAYHWVAGDHALGGERHGKQSVKQWFERMGRVFPKLLIDIEQVEVTGWPWRTTVFVKWRANARLLDGQSSYVNRGVHVFKLRWGKVHSIEEYFDSQAAERSLAIQARAGLDEAAAGPIVS